MFSWQLLRDKGRPNHRFYYSKVTKAEAVGEHAVRFDLAGSDDRELPLILGLMPVLPKHAINPETFEETTLTPLIGSGPYVIGKVDPGRSLTLTRNPNYWGRDLADQSRLLEFRRDPLRLLPRPQRATTKRSSAACSTCAAKTIRPLADRLRLPGAARRPGGQGDVHQRAAEAELLFRVQHAPAGLRRRPRARGDRDAVRLRMDQPELCSSASIGAPRAISRAPSCPRTAGRPTRASARCWRRFPAPCAPTCSTAPGRRRSATAPAATARCCGARSRCSQQAGYELRGTELVERKSGRPFTFEIMVTAAATRWTRALALAVRRAAQARRHHHPHAPGRCRAVRGAPDRASIST